MARWTLDFTLDFAPDVMLRLVSVVFFFSFFFFQGDACMGTCSFLNIVAVGGKGCRYVSVVL